MKFRNSIMALTLLLAACAQQPAQEQEVLTDYVNPLIGSGGHGHVFVGASVPFGMVQLGPTSINETWDWCSGYHQDEASIIGFSHTHLSGTGARASSVIIAGDHAGSNVNSTLHFLTPIIVPTFSLTCIGS